MNTFLLLIALSLISFMCQVFTWYGATFEMDGTTETDYTADEVCLLYLRFLALACVILLDAFTLLENNCRIICSSLILDVRHP